jgi:hypothetical protein
MLPGSLYASLLTHTSIVQSLWLFLCQINLIACLLSTHFVSVLSCSIMAYHHVIETRFL